uniref:G protein-coupled receptor n=1 Tax=Ditylenchus dipsaci TaxID=166011 RepID=A0A915EGR5_9BILA
MLSIAGLIAILEIYLATEGGYPSPPYDSLIHTSASYQVFKESNQQDVMLSLNAKMSIPSYLRIWTFLKNVSANSKVKEINRQLTISLVVQALLPAFVFCILIFCLVVLLIVVDTNLFTMTYLAAPLNWMAVLSPLLTIIIIRPYRNFVLCRQGMKWNMSETYRARRKTLVSVARRMSFGITNSGVVC